MEDLKKCSKCREEKQATFEFFSKTNNGKLSAMCRKCKSEYDKEYRTKNKEKIREYRQKYEKENKEKIANYRKEYRTKNKDKIKGYCEENKEKKSQYNKEYREKHKDKLNKRKRKWTKENKKHLQKYRIENKERDSERAREWSQTERGKELNNQCSAKRRERIKQLPLDFTKKDWHECLEYFGHRCCYCGEKTKLEHEHFIPISKKGSYTKDNMLCSCRRCNASKASDSFFYWYPLQEFYSKEREIKILHYLKKMSNAKGCVVND